MIRIKESVLDHMYIIYKMPLTSNTIPLYLEYICPPPPLGGDLLPRGGGLLIMSAGKFDIVCCWAWNWGGMTPSPIGGTTGTCGYTACGMLKCKNLTYTHWSMHWVL